MTRVLIVCTGNSCRSQMAEGWLKAFAADLEVFSAGTAPASRVSSRAVEVMKEAGVDIRNQEPKSIDIFLNTEFDYVITVCDNARAECPHFSGRVGKMVHMGFEDPTHAVGTEIDIMNAFRKTRDEIRDRFHRWYEGELRPSGV